MSDDRARTAAVEAALRALGLDDKARLLAGDGMWTLPAMPRIGLRALVMSDGPVGVRGVRWTAGDPSLVLPSPTALAATWDPALARRAGRVLAQEARRKGVHLLLAPTVNLHRSPLGGRHFEAYSEDPYLTAEIGTGYVLGVQDGGVGATVKHFVANDAETERFTVDNRVPERALRELYLAPFEAIVERARPWAVMAAYNRVNGVSMTENHHLQNEVLREEWGFDGCTVSDWLAARDTVRAVRGGLDIAMPGPRTVYGPALAAAVRAGEVPEALVDAAARRVLLLAARAGVLDGAPAAVTRPPAPLDGEALAREIARRSFVLVRNEFVDDARALPIDPARTRRVALLGGAARDARILGGGSAQVFPARVVSPLDGLRAALPDGVLAYAPGAEPDAELMVAGQGFSLTAVCRDAAGRVLGREEMADGAVQWAGDLPDGVTHAALHTVEATGTFTPRESGPHSFGTRGTGGFRLTVDGRVLFDGTQAAGPDADPFEAFLGAPVPRGEVALEEGKPVDISLVHTVTKPANAPIEAVAFSLLHREPRRDPDALLAEAVAVAAAADTAVVVVATTGRAESEGFDRTTLALPGRQDELVARVAAVNPRTVVVVNSGAPVELPWRNGVAAVLLGWFPGQEAGTALADVLLGAEEPGGRLPTTWPARLADAPVTEVDPREGELAYGEGVFIGYRAWEKARAVPAYAFGHGLGYTDWSYEALDIRSEGTDDPVATVRVRNTGTRFGREVVQIYLAAPRGGGVERPARRLAGFASLEAAPGRTAEAAIALDPRAFDVWDEAAAAWRRLPGTYTAEAGRSIADRRLTAPVRIDGPAV
ncbi:glycoside hydrolase family 3 C-terminal domain-containing protein [Streptomyces olivoreticuli]|uniref:glycoside hydrolase family 3 protein n=1 Tax=Streptomyces olivoreticuli TaxID=68246 RepID=UPI002659188E|nr:glycoside hydrolase family 3 C-terminal domain-containing protein [Streptomyces olivoreticuli]WKK22115.1 glycoside hydrolase family 3 C-terminal domain-containing protein [Streptomyces olivoreticuli]